MATEAHKNVYTNLNVPHPSHYQSQRNVQQPPKSIRVPIPLHLIKENQAVECVINGNRRNGHISEKTVLDQPIYNPQTLEVVKGKIRIQYTDGTGERQFYEMFSVLENGTDHQRGEYHFHFIPNSEDDIALARHNNSRHLANQLQFSPHTTTTNVDEGTRNQYKKMYAGLEQAAETIKNSSIPTLNKQLMYQIYQEQVKMMRFQYSQSSDVFNFINAMQLINTVKHIHDKNIIEQNKQSHGMLGNVQQIIPAPPSSQHMTSHPNQQITQNITNQDQSNKLSNNSSNALPNTSSNNFSNTSSNNSSNNTNKAAVTYACPFTETCSKTYKARPSLNSHLFSHENEDDYEAILSHPCPKQNCNSRFESIKYLNQHSKTHSHEREPLIPEQKCPKCIEYRGNANAGVIVKGAWKGGAFKKVYCSLPAKKCGFTQNIKSSAHTYAYKSNPKKRPRIN